MSGSDKAMNTLSDNSIENSNVNQVNVKTENINNFYGNIIHSKTKPSIIQEVLEGIIDLSTDDIEATQLDIQPYTIHEKINHNAIIAYKESYEMYMSDKHLIERRLNSLDNGKNPLASKRLYRFIERVYSKYCHHKLPDKRIECICEEIKKDLQRVESLSIEEIAIIPSVVFYVFSKCHIFEKPPSSK